MRITFTADLYLPDNETLTDDEVKVWVRQALKVGWRHQEFDIQLKEVTDVREGHDHD